MRMNNNRHARRGLTLLFSLFPGGGHYYMGLMRRGAFYSVLFLLGIIVLDLLRLDALSVWFCMIVWGISIFDAYHCWRMMQVEDAEVEDSIPLDEWLHSQVDYMDDEEKLSFRKKWMNRLGIGLLILGGLSVLSHLGIFGIFRKISNLIFPAALVVAGFLLIKKNQ